MRLFYALLRKKMPNGHIFRGKDRLVRPVTGEDIGSFKTQIEIEEKNMFLLRHSYLTPEQSFGHSKALEKQQNRIARFNSIPKPFYDNVTLESRLGHVRYSESWDN